MLKERLLCRAHMLMRHTARLAPLQQARDPAAMHTARGGAAQQLGRCGGRLNALDLHLWQLSALQSSKTYSGARAVTLC
jgi:hypothetical protein